MFSSLPIQIQDWRDRPKTRSRLVPLPIVWVIWVAFGLIPFILCSSDSGDSDSLDLPPLELQDPSLRIEKYIQSPDQPWGMAFLPSGEQYLVSGGRGRFLSLYESDRLQKSFPAPVADEIVSKCDATPASAGWLDVALDPDFETNPLLYLSAIFTVVNSSDETIHRQAVVKLSYTPEAISLAEPTEKAVLFEECTRDDFPFPVNSHGGRLAFLGDKTLLLSVGPHQNIGDDFRENTIGLRSQDKDYYAGKILRMTREGEPVCGIEGLADNPFCEEAGNAAEYIYTLGHKNSQGITIDPNSGHIYASEHGEQRGDEVNLLEAGSNYGFPYVCSGSCAPYHPDYATFAEQYPLPDDLREEDLTPAYYYWDTTEASIAPSGIDFYSMEGNYQSSLLVATLRNQGLHRIVVDSDGTPDYRGVILSGSRFRHVRVSEDGGIYILLATDYDTNIVKLGLN